MNVLIENDIILDDNKINKMIADIIYDNCKNIIVDYIAFDDDTIFNGAYISDDYFGDEFDKIIFEFTDNDYNSFQQPLSELSLSSRNDILKSLNNHWFHIEQF